MRVVLLAALVAATSGDPFSVGRYDLALEVDPASREIRGDAAVTIRAEQGTVSEARFSLNRHLRLDSVEADGKAIAVVEGSEMAEGREIRVPLDPPLAKGKQRTLRLRYRGNGVSPGPDGADWMGILLVRPDEIRMSHQAQWYPVVPRDARALSLLAAPVKLALTLPAGLEALGPGEAKGKKPASDGREVHHFEAAGPTKASLLAGKYSAETITKGAFSVRVLAFPEHVAGAKSWAAVALEALESLQSRFGQLARTSYGIAEMRVLNRKRSYNYEAEGFSVYDGVLFDGREPQPEKIAHEVAHLWWGGRVNAAGKGERFLKESLAEMSAYLFVEKERGAEKAKALAARWAERYAGNSGEEHSIAESTFESPRYGEVIYAKGPMALHALRARAGADRFDRGLKGFVDKHAGRAPDLDDFVATMRAAAGGVVDAWAKDWLATTGLPPAKQ